MNYEYTFFDRPVQSRAGRIAAACLMVPVVVGVALITSPLTIPLHFALRRIGRQGFVEDDGRRWRLVIGAQSFRRI